ncbi:MAG: hypothetical protein HZC12_03330 [Nitrospirae bacterium]|nr:hypothetical protein [Nitrospirota bacterium]
MAHDFYCGNCSRWVATCGFSDNNHSLPFSFSATCQCGQRVSGSCGGGKSVPIEEKKETLFQVKCKNCETALSYLLSSLQDKSLSIETTCPKCNSKEVTKEKI